MVQLGFNLYGDPGRDRARSGSTTVCISRSPVRTHSTRPVTRTLRSTRPEPVEASPPSQHFTQPLSLTAYNFALENNVLSIHLTAQTKSERRRFQAVPSKDSPFIL